MRSWKATAFPPPRRILLSIHCPSPPRPPCGAPKLRVWGPCSVTPLLTPPWPGQAPSSVLPAVLVPLLWHPRWFISVSHHPLCQTLSPLRAATFTCAAPCSAQDTLSKSLPDECLSMCQPSRTASSTPLTPPQALHLHATSVLGPLKICKKNYFMLITLIFPP